MRLQRSPVLMPESVRSTASITNEKDGLQRRLKPPANVERLKKTLNFGEIVRITIRVAHCYRKMKNIVHHARLKNILEKLIVVNGSACLDFKNPPFASRMGVSVETLSVPCPSAQKARARLSCPRKTSPSRPEIRASLDLAGVVP